MRGKDAENPANLAVEDNAPTLEVEDTDYGFHYAAVAARPRARTAPWKSRTFAWCPRSCPMSRIIPAPSFFFHVFEVPDSDVRTSTYIVNSRLLAGGSREDHQASRTRRSPLLESEDLRFHRGLGDRFGQDREAMKGDWGGLGGVEKEDAIISLSMGPIFDRTQEHLVAADQAVVRLRRRLLDCVKMVEAGEEPLGARRRI